MHCLVAHLIGVHICECLAGVTVACAADHIGRLIECLNRLGKHELLQLSNLDPATAREQLEQDLALQLERAVERVLELVRADLVDRRVDACDHDAVVVV